MQSEINCVNLPNGDVYVQGGTDRVYLRVADDDTGRTVEVGMSPTEAEELVQWLEKAISHA